MVLLGHGSGGRVLSEATTAVTAQLRWYYESALPVGLVRPDRPGLPRRAAQDTLVEPG